jgi:hypothetical protein
MITSEHAYQVRPRKDHRKVVTAETQPQPRFLKLSAIISQYFIGGMMPESANPVQQPQMIIEIRPFRGDLRVNRVHSKSTRCRFAQNYALPVSEFVRKPSLAPAR